MLKNVYFGDLNHAQPGSKKCCRACAIYFLINLIERLSFLYYENSNTHISIFYASKIQLSKVIVSWRFRVQDFLLSISPSGLNKFKAGHYFMHTF